MDLAKTLRDHNEKKHRYVEKAMIAEAIAQKLEDSLKPLGHFNIPELLDKRRFEYAIPNGAFQQYPAFDKVYIWQLNLTPRREFVEGGQLVKTDMRIAADRNTAPRGIIVSAGLAALDSLRSSGFDLGHIVRFKKFAPFIQPVEEIDGQELTVMVIRDGDIVASEDLAAAYHRREVQIINASEDKHGYDHRFVNEAGDVTGKKVAAYYDPSV